ncbi:ubiquitin domain-containing protein DSK2b-like isoform X6 [Carex littledalei]|uniref:Ubiquitin domain-containing protein DSK2b-like isoform X6 n=1 Tax=Carex littledalei TaxID=544730 RepID=A0A833QT66_9POAL|nr:ubiquitin domain-containing protein DSK2b-like isoform X6 [Carex littledalei]
MGSEGVRSLITLQIQLASNRIKFPFQTELDPTVKELKLLLADLTGIPPDRQCLVYKGHILKNPQTLRSYELEPDQTIYLIRTGLPPSKPVVSLSRNSTTTSPGKTNGLNAANVSQSEPLYENLDVGAIIKSIPIFFEASEQPEVGEMLENPVILRCVLSYLFYLETNRCKASDGADLTKNIKAQTEGSHKLECVYDGQHANGTCLSEMDQACGSDELVEPSLRHDAHKGAIDNFAQILFSDATFLRHYKKQGESINRAIIAMLGWDDPSRFSNSTRVRLGKLLNTHWSPYANLVSALPNDLDYNLSCSYNDSSYGFALEEESEELLALQLAEMEEMGFMNCEENLRALLKSGADVEQAVERLLEKTYPEEGQ